MASLLLCLFVAFAVSPPEAFYRTHSGSRNRTTRPVRLDDHDHDHTLEAIQTGFDLLASSAGDGDKLLAVLPSRVITLGNGGPPGELLLPAESSPVCAVVSLVRGRSPPAA